MRLRAIAALVLAGIGAQSVKQASKLQPARIRFEDRSAASGIRYVLANGAAEDKPIIDCVLGGVALLDFDSDGYLDIFLTNGARIPSLEKDTSAFHNRLFRNNRDGTFSDVTVAAGLEGAGYTMGAAAADYNNDGWTDLYVTGVNRNILYRNNGDGTFSDVTSKAGVGTIGPKGKPWSVAAAWLDYNNDGLLDLFVVNYLDWSFANNRVCGDPGKRLSCSPELYQGLPNILYRNNGDGTFTDVSEEAGIAGHIGKGMSIAIADYDGDGFMDVFVANDKAPNFLFHNLKGKKFEEVGIESGVAFTGDGIPVSNMGVEFRDIDNDGRPDLVITALEGDTFLYFHNQGEGVFDDYTYRAGLGYVTRSMSGWGVGAYDFDNDGYKDLLTANSHVSENAPLYGPHQYRQQNALFRNSGNTFDFAASSSGEALQRRAAHRGAAFGDLDNDGRIDAVVSAIGSQPELLYNRSLNAGHWILLLLRGTSSNRDGIGTQVKLTGKSGLTQYNQATTAVGYASSSDKRVHFGLARDTVIAEIELRWPSGKVQVLHNVRADQVLKVVEP